MVHRFTAEEFHGGVVFEPHDEGDLVSFAEYQSLQAALREALEGWYDSGIPQDKYGRYEELRKLLD